MSFARDARERIRGLLTKEFRQIFRDPRMLRVIFVSPAVQLLVFGYAVSTDLANTRTVLVDLDASAASRELGQTITAGGYFEIVRTTRRPGDLVRALEGGDAVVGIEIPRGFQEDLARGEASLQILLDGSNSNVASVAQGYLAGMLQRFALSATDNNVTGGVTLVSRAWFNPDLSSRDYNVPAVVGALILLVCLLLTSLAVVREREIGTLEQLKVSPLTAGELIAGKTIPFGVIGMVDLVVVSTVAILWFGIPFEGNAVVLLLASMLYITAGLGIGLLISSVSRTQQEAFLVTFMIAIPALLLSGFMFPVESMPRVFETATLLNPVRHYIEIVRAVFLKGAGLDVLWPQHLWLLGLGTFLLGSAALRFRGEVG
jgi:ABC-2 type transport system permease protein